MVVLISMILATSSGHNWLSLDADRGTIAAISGGRRKRESGAGPERTRPTTATQRRSNVTLTVAAVSCCPGSTGVELVPASAVAR